MDSSLIEEACWSTFHCCIKSFRVSAIHVAKGRMDGIQTQRYAYLHDAACFPQLTQLWSWVPESVDGWRRSSEGEKTALTNAGLEVRFPFPHFPTSTGSQNFIFNCCWILSWSWFCVCVHPSCILKLSNPHLMSFENVFHVYFRSSCLLMYLCLVLDNICTLKISEQKS